MSGALRNSLFAQLDRGEVSEPALGIRVVPTGFDGCGRPNAVFEYDGDHAEMRRQIGVWPGAPAVGGHEAIRRALDAVEATHA